MRTLPGSLLLAFALSSAVFGAGVADAPPFSLTPKQLLDEANSSGLQKTGDAVLLLNEDHWTFKADGKLHHTIHAVFQVLTPGGVSNWSALQFAWEPWREQRPVVKERTVTPDGVVHELDPKTIADAPAGSPAPQSFSDVRVIQCPLPSVAVGAVVEQLTENDETPVLGSTAFRVFLISSVPLRLARVIVDYPAALTLRYKCLLAPDVKPVQTTDAAGVHLVFERRNVEAAEEEPPLLPPDAPRYPGIIFSTAPSWESIADQYAGIVDQQLAAALPGDNQPPAGGGATREASIAALVRKLHAEVRYTGIEFGQAAIVPTRPDETLKRGYGDCKDKASLLVAMLRRAGIPAYVALLNGGFGPDVDPDFPGMGMFNHAIVYVPGKPDIWIDATSPYSQPGTLPGPDQGRRALIAAKGTKSLILTPEMPSSATVEMSTHEYTLPEYGPARIVELSQGTGNIDAALRASTGPIDTDTGKKAMQEYIQKSYDTKSDIGFDHSKVDDLTTPFQMRLTIPDSRNLLVTESGTNIPINPAAMLGTLPPYFLLDDSQDPRAKQKRLERTQDFELPQAFVTETTYRIHMPSGFVLKKLPDNQDVALGPVRLTARYGQEKETVIATLRLDSGKRRYSVEEGRALNAAAVEYMKSPPQTISIEPAGQAHLDAGRIGEAIQAFRAMSERQPDKALYHVQTSRALLAAGAGQLARAEARRATEVDAFSSVAWKNLGYVLERDLVDRQFKKGWDPAGAEEAYRRAIDLDRHDLDAVQSLVTLFEYDENGDRYASPKRLETAIEYYRDQITPDVLNQDRFMGAYVFVLAYAGRFDELQTRLEKLPQSNENLSLRAVAIAVKKGVNEAVSDTAKNTGDAAQRAEVLERAGGILTFMGRYAEAAALMEAGATGAADSSQVLARANFMRNLHHFDCAAMKPDSPENAVRRLACLSASGQQDAALAEYDPAALGPHSRAEFREAWEGEGMRGAGQNANRSSMVDFAVSGLKLTVDDNGSGGYRVKQTALGSPALQSTFVVRHGAGYKVLASSVMPQGVGRQVLSEISHNQIEGARKWLNWLRDDLKSQGGDDPLSGAAFPHLWTKGVAGTDEQVRLAAASLIAPTPDGAEVLPLLHEAVAKDASDPKRDYIDLSYLLAAHAARAWAEALPVAQALVDRHPESGVAHVLVADLLCSLKRGGEAERFVQDWVKADPENMEAQRLYSRVFEKESKFKEAEEQIKKVAESSAAGPPDWNQYGWTALFAGDLTPEKIEAVRHGVGSSADPAILHTVAAMYAELGKGSEAREELLGAMNSWGLAEPNSSCWYVFGRISEGYGVRDAAIAYYAKVQRPVDSREGNTSTYELAQKRLAAMK